MFDVIKAVNYDSEEINTLQLSVISALFFNPRVRLSSSPHARLSLAAPPPFTFAILCRSSASP